MSRTIKTMPWAVRVIDARAAEPRHDHSRGPCDLPPLTMATFDWSTRVAHRCYWDCRRDFYYTEEICGCAECTGQFWRRADRRRSRHRARVELQLERYLKPSSCE